jgi:hypothetical protein
MPYPDTDALGPRLPKKGFLYIKEKRPFSDGTSSAKVVRAILTASGMHNLFPSTVDHHVAMLFLFAADIAHTLYHHGHNFWQVVMRSIPWTTATGEITPRIIKKLTHHIMEARLRWVKHREDLPPLEMNTTARCVDMFFEALEEAGMDRFIPKLDEDDLPSLDREAGSRSTVNNDDAISATSSAQHTERQQDDPSSADNPGVDVEAATAKDPTDKQTITTATATSQATMAQPTVSPSNTDPSIITQPTPTTPSDPPAQQPIITKRKVAVSGHHSFLPYPHERSSS